MSNPKTETIELELDSDTLDWLNKTAAHYKVPIDDVISDALILYFRKEFANIDRKSCCKLHPKYQAMRKPTSQKIDCTCLNDWNFKQYLISAQLKALPDDNTY